MTDDPPDPRSMTARLANFSWGWAAFWAFVFGLNLILPVAFAWGMTEDGGRIGLLVQVSVIGVMGLLASGMRFSVAKSVTVGGMMTALLQAVVILHFLAGAVALGVTDWVLGSTGTNGFGHDWLTEPRAALAVLVMATQLLLVSLALGGAVRWRYGPFDEPIPPKGDEAATPAGERP